jgi:hypothetical protein
MCVFKYHAFIYFLRPLPWYGTTSHGLFARGTQLECSMGLLYQLIGVHKGGGFQSPSCALFSFPPKFGLIFTSCQLLHLLTVLSPTTQLLTAHTVSTLVLLLYLYFFYLDFAGHSRLDSLSPNPDGYKKCIAVQLRVIYDSQMTNRKKLKNIFTSGRFESYSKFWKSYMPPAIRIRVNSFWSSLHYLCTLTWRTLLCLHRNVWPLPTIAVSLSSSWYDGETSTESPCSSLKKLK